MSQQPPTAQQQPLYPPPPIYAEQYSTENIKKGLVLHPPPLQTKFDVFAEHIDLEGPLLPSLTDLGYQQLYSGTGNWRSELKKLNRSLIAAFLDLIEILIRCPDNLERVEKIDTIRNLFINIHHLVNEYRPVQARDTLRQMIIHQNQEIISVTEKLNKIVETGTEVLEKLNIALSRFAIDEAIPKGPKSCEENAIDNQSGSSPQYIELSAGTVGDELKPPKPIEIPARLSSREIQGVKNVLQKEFGKHTK